MKSEPFGPSYNTDLISVLFFRLGTSHLLSGGRGGGTFSGSDFFFGYLQWGWK